MARTIHVIGLVSNAMLIPLAAKATAPNARPTIIIGPKMAIAPMDRAERPPTMAIAPTAILVRVPASAGFA